MKFQASISPQDCLMISQSWALLPSSVTFANYTQLKSADSAHEKQVWKLFIQVCLLEHAHHSLSFSKCQNNQKSSLYFKNRFDCWLCFAAPPSLLSLELFSSTNDCGLWFSFNFWERSWLYHYALSHRRHERHESNVCAHFCLVLSVNYDISGKVLRRLDVK